MVSRKLKPKTAARPSQHRDRPLVPPALRFPAFQVMDCQDMEPHTWGCSKLMD